jgi:hypothetical protein
VVALNNAQANVVGGGDTIDFEGSSGNVAELYSTNNNWDTVNGSSGVVALNDAQANVVGGANVVDFGGSTGNIVELYSTNNNWDSVYGSNGVVALNSAQANVMSGSNTIDMQGSSGNLLALYGNSESVVFQPQFGASAVGGFNSTDTMTFSASDFANFQALQQHMSQSGVNTLITLDASDKITLTNVNLSTLTASQFHFV